MKKSQHPGKKVSEAPKETKYAYWRYKDGSSYWGIRLYRGSELPEEISKEEHQNADSNGQ
jgi:hypothetical protein